MNPDRFSRQASSILRGVTELPGGKAVNIQARRLPRSLAHDPPTRYEFEERRFAFDEPEPPTLPPLHGMDDIAITVEGVLAGGEDGDIEHVVLSARSLLSSAGAEMEWDVRALVKTQDEGTMRHYQVTLFTDAPAPPPYAQ